MDKTRFDNIIKSIDSSVLMDLEQIRRYLRRGKASVMVGAGFSKNAVMSEGVRMCDWGELCSRFHKELYGREPLDYELRLKSALRLAQQVESVKGRNALEELIKESLPNNAIAPGDLHEKLVNLNWRDIFTTNYDTLLEDAAIKICKHYNVVTSKDSLIYQPHPRIVKVHGSFPDNRPFIITEEDYRTYPSRFPEFVNTVRQALIETQFVLIGFSGDDPNFLSWLGWFRDIMGHRMLPVYLIHIGSMPHLSESQLMEKRGVRLIPTASCSTDVTEAIDFILSYLGDEYLSEIKWSGKISISRISNDLSLKELTMEMRTIRESYPNWLILPVDKIYNFSDTWELFPFYEKKFQEIEKDLDKLEFLSELDWRLSVSFMPVWIDHSWYVKALEWVAEISGNVTADARKYIENLTLSLLRIFRQRRDDKFLRILQKIENNYNSASYSIYRKLQNEKAIWYLQHNDIASCKKILELWAVSADDYKGVLWKSRILVEIGENRNAIMLLEQSVDDARRKLLLNASSNFHSSALIILESCLKVAKREKPDNNVNTFPPFIKYRDYATKEMDTENKGGYKRIHGFNIGNTTSTWSSGGNGYILKYVGAARYFLIAEEYGRAIGLYAGSLNSDVAKKALPLLAEIDIKGAISYLIEANDEKSFELTFSRDFLMKKFDQTVINGIFDELYESKSLIQGDKDQISPRDYNIVIPLLSRLCVLTDVDRVELITQLLIRLHGKNTENFTGYLTTAYNSLPLEQCKTIWWEILKKPVALDFYNNDYPRPSAVINEWDGDENVINNIICALKVDNPDVLRAGVERLGEVYLLLPEKYLLEIDNFIASEWESFHSTNIINVLGVNVESLNGKPWETNFRHTLNEFVDKFLLDQVSGISSSVPIDNFSDSLALFINCRKYLTTDQIERILERICCFITENSNSISEDDSETLMGGMRRFWTEAMRMVNLFISRTNIAKVSPGLVADLLGCLNEYRDLFPFATSIIKMLTFDGRLMRAEGKHNQRLVRHILSKSIQSGSPSFIYDGFNAVLECYNNNDGKFGMQNIVEEVINRLHYLHDDISICYIKCLMTWIRVGIIKDTKLKRLIKFLNELPDKVMINQDISSSVKADLLFYGGRLVGQLSEYMQNSDEMNECRIHWSLIVGELPADIRKGFFLGMELETGRKKK